MCGVEIGMIILSDYADIVGIFTFLTLLAVAGDRFGTDKLRISLSLWIKSLINASADVFTTAYYRVAVRASFLFTLITIFALGSLFKDTLSADLPESFQSVSAFLFAFIGKALVVDYALACKSFMLITLFFGVSGRMPKILKSVTLILIVIVDLFFSAKFANNFARFAVTMQNDVVVAIIESTKKPPEKSATQTFNTNVTVREQQPIKNKMEAKSVETPLSQALMSLINQMHIGLMESFKISIYLLNGTLVFYFLFGLHGIFKEDRILSWEKVEKLPFSFLCTCLSLILFLIMVGVFFRERGIF